MSVPEALPKPAGPGPQTRVSVPLPRLSPRVRSFLATEAGSGAALLAAAVAALVWANLPGGTYLDFWHIPVSVSVGDEVLRLDLQHLVNDGAMAVFFLVVGLEISREAVVGDLRDRRRVLVPALGAVGGLVAPALLYWACNHGGAGSAGWGIPMSTDTAFLVGVLALFGPRCPDQLRLFLLTLAIVDDIGAITVMAVFYTHHISVPALVAAALFVVALVMLRWLQVWQLTPYVLTGLGLWAAVFASGVHPTLAGVTVGLLVPATPVGDDQRQRVRFYGLALLERADARRARLASLAVRATVPPNDRLQEALHPTSAFVVIPLFGLSNAGVTLDSATLSAAATSPITIGVAVGLLAGKAIGVAGGAALALRTGMGVLPGRVRYGHLLGGAVLAGIGFTISLFITDLAFDDAGLRDQAKIGVLGGSVLAALLGSLLLRYLGERLPLCSVDDDAPPPPLPSGPWLDPDAVPAR